MKILLVEPEFPIPIKSKNHKDFLPIGLLKIAAYFSRNNIHYRLIRGHLDNHYRKSEIIHFNPNEVWITSLFTYWASYVKDAVHHYKNKFPKAKIKVGGIYASLRPKKEVLAFWGIVL